MFDYLLAAMAFPGEGFESTYRNNIDEVAEVISRFKFLNDSLMRFFQSCRFWRQSMAISFSFTTWVSVIMTTTNSITRFFSLSFQPKEVADYSICRLTLCCSLGCDMVSVPWPSPSLPLSPLPHCAIHARVDSIGPPKCSRYTLQGLDTLQSRGSEIVCVMLSLGWAWPHWDCHLRLLLIHWFLPSFHLFRSPFVILDICHIYTFFRVVWMCWRRSGLLRIAAFSEQLGCHGSFAIEICKILWRHDSQSLVTDFSSHFVKQWLIPWLTSRRPTGEWILMTRIVLQNPPTFMTNSKPTIEIYRVDERKVLANFERVSVSRLSRNLFPIVFRNWFSRVIAESKTKCLSLIWSTLSSPQTFWSLLTFAPLLVWHSQIIAFRYSCVLLLISFFFLHLHI